MRKVTISLELEIQDGRGIQEIATGASDCIEETAKAALPAWATIADVKMEVEPETESVPGHR